MNRACVCKNALPCIINRDHLVLFTLVFSRFPINKAYDHLGQEKRRGEMLATKERKKGTEKKSVQRTCNKSVVE